MSEVKCEEQDVPSPSFLLPILQILPLGVQGPSGLEWGTK